MELQELKQLLSDVEYLKKRVQELETEKANRRAVKNIPGYDGSAEGKSGWTGGGGGYGCSRG